MHLITINYCSLFLLVSSHTKLDNSTSVFTANNLALTRSDFGSCLAAPNIGERKTVRSSVRKHIQNQKPPRLICIAIYRQFERCSDTHTEMHAFMTVPCIHIWTAALTLIQAPMGSYGELMNSIQMLFILQKSNYQEDKVLFRQSIERQTVYCANEIKVSLGTSRFIWEGLSS